MNSVAKQADYDSWLIQEVQAALDDVRPSVSHAQVVAEWEQEVREIRASMLETAEV